MANVITIANRQIDPKALVNFIVTTRDKKLRMLACAISRAHTQKIYEQMRAEGAFDELLAA